MLVRKDECTSQKIETALIFHQMLGWQDAHDYLRGEEVPQEIIERVLFDGNRRASPAVSCDAASTTSFPARVNEAFYASSGRRKDILRMAVVQAALVLRPTLGSERVEKMLRREQLPDEVITRVLQGEASVLRTRPDTPPVA